MSQLDHCTDIAGFMEEVRARDAAAPQTVIEYKCRYAPEVYDHFREAYITAMIDLRANDPSVQGVSFAREPSVGAAFDVGGGYERASMPNPNFAGGVSQGQHTSPQFGTQPAVSNQLTANLDLSQRASKFDQKVADQERHERRAGGGGMQNPMLKDKRWSALLQALQEAGADTMQTGARAGWEDPGFYDTQATMRADAQGRQQLLEALLMNQGRTLDATFVRGMR